MHFSMLTFLTSGIKLNHIKGPNNPIFVFNYSCMVRKLVLEALEDLSRDSELIKYTQKTTIFFTFSSSFNRPLRNFIRTKVYPERLCNNCYVNAHGVEVEKRAWVPPFCCNNGDHFWSKSWGLRGKDGSFTSCFPFSCPRPPSKVLSNCVEHELGGKGQLTDLCGHSEC